MSDPLVSVVVPLYNRQDLIAETIQSVIEQSYEHWELLIVDDGSMDKSFQVAERFATKDQRIKVRKRVSTLKGASVCRNEGLEVAKGDYVIFLDSDDLFKTDCLQNRMDLFAENPTCDFIVCFPEIFQKHPGDTNQTWGRVYSDYLSGFLDRAAWITIAVTWRRNWLNKIGGWKETLPSYQDWELHIRALISNPRFRVFETAKDAWLRRGEDTRISQQSERKKEHLRSRTELIVDIYRMIDSKKMLNRRRKQSLTKQFVLLSFLSRRISDSQNYEECMNQIETLNLVHSPFKRRVIKIYVLFEANTFFRLPFLSKTLRRAVKLMFKTIIPNYLL